MIYTKIINTIILLICAICLISCSHINSDFDCPKKPGINCESIDQINARVDSGQFNYDCQARRLNCADLPAVNYLSVDQNFTYPKRSKEKTLKIFVASYVDKDGNFHDQNTIYTVAKPSHWI